jgi:sec-independent protein translocase protein TatA
MGEIVLLIVLLLALFGAKRLPEVGRAAGTAIREFKSALNGTDIQKTELQRAEPQKAEVQKTEGNGGGNA